MTRIFTLPSRRASLRALAGGLLLFVLAACGSSDGVGPSSEFAAPADSTQAPATDTTVAAPTDSAPPADSTVAAPADSAGVEFVPVLDTRSALPGIVFATDNMPTDFLNSVNNGTKLGGPIGPSNVMSVLAATKAKGGRIFLKLCKGSDGYVKNSDGTFSFTKWKALVDQYKGLNFGPYISDGTLVGHFLIDEPHRASRWGGKIIPHATLEAMAQYSKAIWPTWTTIVHTQTPWLANTSVTFRYLDAGWTQYAAGKGDVTKWAGTEVAAAKSKRLGLVIGLNVLGGGNGSSGIRIISGGWAMSAAELRNYGTVALNQSYSCAFSMWNHNTTYFGRSDVKSATAALALLARSHPKTACQQ